MMKMISQYFLGIESKTACVLPTLKTLEHEANQTSRVGAGRVARSEDLRFGENIRKALAYKTINIGL